MFLKVYSSTCPILEVSVLNLTGVVISNKSVLHWASENESNLMAYDVEKSFDGIHFTNVGTVKVSSDAGTSAYTFSDPQNLVAPAFYRLKLVNKNSSENRYSKIVSVYNTQSAFTLNSINPFNNSLQINVFVPSDGVIELNLCDIFGNVVRKKTMHLYRGNSKQTLDDLYNLPNGIYVLRALFNGNMVQNKLIKTY